MSCPASGRPLLSGATVVLATLLVVSGAATAQESMPAPQASALRHVTELEQQIHDLSMELWAYSEIALREARSAHEEAPIPSGGILGTGRLGPEGDGQEGEDKDTASGLSR